MPKLVRDDGFQLGLATSLEQCVPEHDSPSASEARHIGVALRRPAARVGDEYVADGNSGSIRQRAELVCEPLVLQRTEAVEDRLQEHGSHEREQRDEHGRSDGSDHRPPARERAGRTDEPDERDPGEDGPDRETLEAICSPAADRLCREPPGAFVPEPPDGEGQAREGRRREHERREHQHLQPPGRREPRHPLARTRTPAERAVRAPARPAESSRAAGDSASRARFPPP